MVKAVIMKWQIISGGVNKLIIVVIIIGSVGLIDGSNEDETGEW